MPLKKLQFYIVLMFVLFSNYVFAALLTSTTYTLREAEKYEKWLLDSRVFKLDAVDTYYLYGRPWKKTYTYCGRYNDCERDHSNNFRGRYLACPVNHFKYTRSYTQCFVCDYSFKAHFHWTQKKFFVEGIGQFESSKNSGRPYVSKILGEGLERMHRWKTSIVRLHKDFNPELILKCYGSGCIMGFP